MNLRTAQHEDGTWWVEGLPPYRVGFVMCTDCGPYDTRKEAEVDRRGLERFYKSNPPAREAVEVLPPIERQPGQLF